MIAMTLDQVASCVGGTLVPAGAGPVVLTGVVTTDSREITPGGLFVARVGQHADGMTFVGDAAAQGAAAALTAAPTSELPCVVVPDVAEAFKQLAHHVVAAVPGLSVVGITGSSGKTSTKDLLAQVLEAHGETVAPVNSYNDEVGLPLTALRVTETTRFLVAEMGADGPGHIARLTQVVRPDVAVVLNVGVAHLAGFGSRAEIAETKAAIVEALPPDGTAILNADDPVVAAMRDRTTATVVTFGRSQDATYRAHDVTLDSLGRARFVLSCPSGSYDVRLAVHGEHHVSNALAVVAAVGALGIPAEQAVASLQAAGATSRWRMEVHERADGVTIINDAYNANPDSMKAGLSALAAIGAGRRRIAVLGAMLELGEESEALHRSVGEHARALGIEQCVVVGSGAVGIVSGYGEGAVLLTEPTSAEEDLRARLRPGDVVLLKSSRDAGLRYLGDRLVGLEVPC